MTDRIKFAYLTYDNMLSKLETGEINEYDIIYSKDKYVTYLITEDLQPLELRSRVYIFDSVNEAEIKLNESSDTYVGQVVAVLLNDTYRGYIVNKRDDKFVVNPLWEHPESIDYDTLGNRPIVNLTGNLDNTVIISELDTGNYSVTGQYKINQLDKTTYSTSGKVLFIVQKYEDTVKIKRITSDNITDYTITNDSIITDNYITTEYLKENNYTTTTYVDLKIEALQKAITEDVQSYVEKIVQEQFGTILDEKIESKIGEILIPVSDSEIEKLFINKN